MAKSSNGKGGGSSRIRFIMLDAELSDGDLSQITNAIQNALRPTAMVVQQRLAGPAQVSGAIMSSNDVDAKLDGNEVEDASPPDERQAAPTVRTPRSSKPTKYRTPKVVPDLDLKSDPSFESYAKTKKATTEIDRFLVVAAWFHDCRKVESITVDDVYTCYRAIGWSISIGDFSQPLRDLKRRQYVTSGEKGYYSINHLGLGRVAKLGDN